jgi:hypothetical protein
VLGRAFFPPAIFPESGKRPPILLGSGLTLAPVGDPFSALERRLGLLVSRGSGVRSSVSVPTTDFFASKCFLPRFHLSVNCCRVKLILFLSHRIKKFEFS